MQHKDDADAGREASTSEAAGPLPAVAADLTNGKSGAAGLAELKVRPALRHATVTARINRIGQSDQEAQLGDIALTTAAICRETRAGDLSAPTDLLTAQALSLDALFTDMMSRSLNNLGQYPEAAERYMRMAMKAQTQCRTTIEALTKLARGGEQVVRHIHVDNRGGQAVIAETVLTGERNEFFDGQSHDQTTDAPVAALRSPHPLGDGLPLPGNAERTVSHSWRDESGSTER